MMSEFVGTFLFLLFAFGGTNVVNIVPSEGESLAANPAKLMYIALCFGMSLAVNAVRVESLSMRLDASTRHLPFLQELV